VFAAAIVLAGCGAPATSLSPAVPAPSSSESPAEVLAIDGLPEAAPDPAVLTAVCDPYSDDGAHMGEPAMYCSDAVALALRAMRTVTPSSVQRIYVRRAPCATRACTLDEWSTATAIAWTDAGQFSVPLDSRSTTVTRPAPTSGADWPVGFFVNPPIDRPVIQGAPPEIAARMPHAFCGRADTGQPTVTVRCFRDAVLLGLHVELLEIVHGTEGGDITWLYRYAGHGAVLRYVGEGGNWVRQAGALIVGPGADAWSFEQWSPGDPVS
jgi:hypothetical protein